MRHNTQVPSLNDTKPELLRPNTLVRFRGMVQDMGNPEFYLGGYKNPGESCGDGRKETRFSAIAVQELQN